MVNQYKGFILVLTSLLLVYAQFAEARQRRLFDPGCVGFSVTCDGLVLGYKIQSMFVLPGETLHFEIVDAKWKNSYHFQSDAGRVTGKTVRQWMWEVPHVSGNYTAEIVQQPGGETMQLNLFVLVPFDQVQNGMLNQFPIGQYPEPKAGEVNPHMPPEGFFEVNSGMLDMQLMPHFTLRQFLGNNADKLPQYIILDERLLIKLETLLAKVNAQGYPCQTLSISSAFRTPTYNQKVSKAGYSLHLWGQAADICVDQNWDGKMDDLNHNGRSDLGDVKIIEDIVEHLDRELRHQDKIGGIGLYDDMDNHGPFVHIDVRGESARWKKSNHKRR